MNATVVWVKSENKDGLEQQLRIYFTRLKKRKEYDVREYQKKQFQSNEKNLNQIKIRHKSVPEKTGIESFRSSILSGSLDFNKKLQGSKIKQID
jgi:hypothetical protein